MRVATPDELKTHAYPVLAAAISDEELSNWFPVPFQSIADPQEAAEPSKAALIRLDSGEYFVLFYGELSNQVTLRIPTSVDASAFMQALFLEVPLPKSRIVWRRRDARLPQGVAAKTIAVPRNSPKRTARNVAAKSRPSTPRRK